MNEEEHREQHIESHKVLDGVVADFLHNTDKGPSMATVMELLEWSHEQTFKTIFLSSDKKGEGEKHG